MKTAELVSRHLLSMMNGDVGPNILPDHIFPNHDLGLIILAVSCMKSGTASETISSKQLKGILTSKHIPLTKKLDLIDIYSRSSQEKDSINPTSLLDLSQLTSSKDCLYFATWLAMRCYIKQAQKAMDHCLQNFSDLPDVYPLVASKTYHRLPRKICKKWFQRRPSHSHMSADSLFGYAKWLATNGRYRSAQRIMQDAYVREKSEILGGFASIGLIAYRSNKKRLTVHCFRKDISAHRLSAEHSQLFSMILHELGFPQTARQYRLPTGSIHPSDHLQILRQIYLSCLLNSKSSHLPSTAIQTATSIIRETKIKHAAPAAFSVIIPHLYYQLETNKPRQELQRSASLVSDFLAIQLTERDLTDHTFFQLLKFLVSSGQMKRAENLWLQRMHQQNKPDLIKGWTLLALFSWVSGHNQNAEKYFAESSQHSPTTGYHFFAQAVSAAVLNHVSFAHQRLHGLTTDFPDYFEKENVGKTAWVMIAILLKALGYVDEAYNMYSYAETQDHFAKCRKNILDRIIPAFESTPPLPALFKSSPFPQILYPKNSLSI